jgi:proteasome accessory factor A
MHTISPAESIAPQIFGPDPEGVDRRIFGVEQEYEAVYLNLAGKQIEGPWGGLILPGGPLYFAQEEVGAQPGVGFGKNGTRQYLDVGSHPEHATAEQGSALDATLGDVAAERVMGRGIGQYIEASPGMSGGRLRKRVLQYPGLNLANLPHEGTAMTTTSWGRHENYLMPRTAFENLMSDERFRALHRAHFITRSLYAGAGMWAPTVEDPTRMFAAQKMQDVRTLVNAATTASRPILNTRDEPHADPEKYARLHTIPTDGLFSISGMWLSMVSSSLVLRLIEHPEVAQKVFREYPDITDMFAASYSHEATKVIGYAHKVARDPLQPFEKRGGKAYSAVEVQRLLHTMCAAGAKEYAITAEERAGLQFWDETLTAFERGEHEQLTWIDWIARAGRMRKVDAAAKAKDFTEEKRLKALEVADVAWDSIIEPEERDPKRAKMTAHRLLRPESMQQIPGYTQALGAQMLSHIDYLQHGSPTDTRSWARTELMRRGLDDGRIVDIADWEAVRIQDLMPSAYEDLGPIVTTTQTILLNEPFSTEVPAIWPRPKGAYTLTRAQLEVLKAEAVRRMTEERAISDGEEAAW